MRFFLVAFVGCGGQSGDEGTLPVRAYDCGEQTVDEDAPLDVLPEGFSVTPAELIAHTEGTWAGTVVYLHDKSSVDAQMTVAHEGGVRLTEWSGGEDAAEYTCSSTYEVHTVVELTAVEGRFRLEGTTWDRAIEHEPHFSGSEVSVTLDDPTSPRWGTEPCESVDLAFGGRWRLAGSDGRFDGYLEWMCWHADEAEPYLVPADLFLDRVGP